MSRLALLALIVCAACSKSAGNQDKVATPPPSGGASSGDVIAVPQGGPPVMPGTHKDGAPAPVAAAGDDDRSKLKPEEGKLAVEAPTDAKPGAEAIAKITVTPASGYHVNTEYPVKLTLNTTDGVNLAKAELLAGGHTQGKGDADSFDEKLLAFSVKLTPAAAGSYTVNGTFKFAVCDANQCLPKRETVAITVAAK